jgi:hypothetical protein
MSVKWLGGGEDGPGRLRYGERGGGGGSGRELATGIGPTGNRDSVENCLGGTLSHSVNGPGIFCVGRKLSICVACDNISIQNCLGGTLSHSVTGPGLFCVGRELSICVACNNISVEELGSGEDGPGEPVTPWLGGA